MSVFRSKQGTTTAAPTSMLILGLSVIALPFIVIIGLIVFVVRRKKKRGPSVAKTPKPESPNQTMMPPTQPYPSGTQTPTPLSQQEYKGLGVETKDTPILKDYQLFQNYIRPHMALDGRTPAEAAGIQVKGDNKWLTIIQNASRKTAKS